MIVDNIFTGAYKDKTVLITGNTGFKGAWLSIFLNRLGANVFGISDKSLGPDSIFEVCHVSKISETFYLDIRNQSELQNKILEIKPDYIFHLAAQALVHTSYDNPIETFEVNSIGTLNILESLRSYDKDLILTLITSDKVYRNIEVVWGYRENDEIGGEDPYSASKGAAEIIINSYIKSFFKNNNKIKINIARAGNVIGGGDWSENRIVPDCINSLRNKRKLVIRNPNATRPWQHVLEPIGGYLLLAQSSNSFNINHEAYNFGPPSNQNYSVEDLINQFAKHFPSLSFEVHHSDIKPEAGLLKLNCDKALSELGWSPILNFEETVEFTAAWYDEFFKNPDNLLEFTEEQIDIYQDRARNSSSVWF